MIFIVSNGVHPYSHFFLKQLQHRIKLENFSSISLLESSWYISERDDCSVCQAKANDRLASGIPDQPIDDFNLVKY